MIHWNDEAFEHTFIVAIHPSREGHISLVGDELPWAREERGLVIETTKWQIFWPTFLRRICKVVLC